MHCNLYITIKNISQIILQYKDTIGQFNAIR